MKFKKRAVVRKSFRKRVRRYRKRYTRLPRRIGLETVSMHKLTYVADFVRGAGAGISNTSTSLTGWFN